jgi:CDGSH-type Zn-finger protein
MCEPVVTAKAPMAVEIEAGQAYWWCSCGKSARQPFREGSQKKL